LKTGELREKGMGFVKPDYKQDPKVLLAWGLGPDFNSGRGIAARLVHWMKQVIKTLGFASIVLLSSF